MHIWYLLIVNSVQEIETGAVFVVNNYIFSLIWGTDSMYPFDSHSKDENDNLSSSGTPYLLNFTTFHSLENCIRSVYYNAYLITLYFSLQFIKLHCTVNAKSALKCLLKKAWLSAKRHRDLNLQKRKHENPEKKGQGVKRKYDDKKESVKRYMKKKIKGESNIKSCI